MPLRVAWPSMPRGASPRLTAHTPRCPLLQLLHQYVPLAAGMLAVLVPLCEPMGWRGAPPGSLLGYVYSPGAVVAIAISAVLGLLVNLSTFLVGAGLPGRAGQGRLVSTDLFCKGLQPPCSLRARPCAHAAAQTASAGPSPHSTLPLLCAHPPQVIGATSSLTYNVVGHIKTVLILSGGERVGGMMGYAPAGALARCRRTGVCCAGTSWLQQRR